METKIIIERTYNGKVKFASNINLCMFEQTGDNKIKVTIRANNFERINTFSIKN